jgi:hypothetical protein
VLEELGDPTHLGVHTRRGDEQLGPAAHDRGVHEPQAVAGLGIRGDGLVDGDGFAGERRLVDGDGLREQEPAVGGDPVAGLEQDHVTRDELLPRDLGGEPVAPHPYPRIELAVLGGHGGLGAPLLHVAEGGGAHEHDRDDDGVLQVTERRRQRGRGGEDHHQEVLELVGEAGPGRPGRGFGQSVGAVGGQASLGLGGGEAGGSVVGFGGGGRRVGGRVGPDGIGGRGGRHRLGPGATGVGRMVARRWVTGASGGQDAPADRAAEERDGLAARTRVMVDVLRWES